MQASIRSMQCVFPILKAIPPVFMTVLAALCLSGCKSSSSGDEKVPEPTAKSEVDVGFLLTMSFDEAGAISASKGEVPGVARIAADSIEVLRFGKQGEMRRLRAKGNVFVEMDGGQSPARALAQEAYITESEVILRGMPALQRGAGLLEGLTDKTVFYIFGSQVRAIGRHRMKDGLFAPTPPTDDEAAVLAVLRSAPGTPPRLPEAGPWRAGPNPLLPPLDESAVPDNIKAEMRKQAEAEAVLQRSRNIPSDLPDTPLSLPSHPPPEPPPEVE